MIPKKSQEDTNFIANNAGNGSRRTYISKGENAKIVSNASLYIVILYYTFLGGVHKLRLQEEVVGRWSKNVHFLSTFMP